MKKLTILFAALAMAGCASTSKSGSGSSGSPQMMFVQSSEDIRVDPAAGTFRLVKVSQQTIFFSDRPERIAGHIKMTEYLQEWTSKAGKDNFGADPPNATISIYEPGRLENTLVVVKISNPVREGADLIYSYKVLEGKMPSGGGATTIFIDWIAYRRYGGYHPVYRY
jgi:hypothetical protein